MEDREERRNRILSQLLDEDLRRAFTVEEAVALQTLRNSKAPRTITPQQPRITGVTIDAPYHEADAAGVLRPKPKKKGKA